MPRRIFVILASLILLCGLGINAVWGNEPLKYEPDHILYGSVSVDGVLLTHATPHFTQYVVFMRIDELPGIIAASYTMGTSIEDEYYLIVQMSSGDREPDTAQSGDTAHIFVDTDTNPDSGNEVEITGPPYTIGNTGELIHLDINASILPGQPGDLVAFVGVGNSPDFSKVDVEFTAAGGDENLGTVDGYEAKILQSATPPATWAAAGDTLDVTSWASLLPGGQSESRTINLLSDMAYGGSYYVSLRAYDSGGSGPMATAQVNMPPQVSNLQISPANPKTANDLTASYDCADPDPGDTCVTAEIRWLKGGAEQSAYNDLMTLPSSATAEGDEWSFTVSASDGHRFGVTETSDPVTIENTAPTADADGPLGEEPNRYYRVKVDTPLTFNGSGSSDPDNDPLTYSWDFDTSTPPAEDSTEENPQHTYTALGTYNVTLTVTDDDLASDTDATTVQVVENDPPTITMMTVSGQTAPFTGLVGQPVNFAGHVSDTDDPPENITCSWDFDSDGVEDGTSQSSTWDHTAMWTYTAHGTYTVTLIASDLLADSEPAVIEITIQAPPEAAFTWVPEPQNEGLPIAFTDASSDADGTISWAWNFGDGNTSPDQNPSHTYTDDNTYAVILIVTDNDGLTDTVSHDVTVLDLGPTAAFTWTPEPQDEGAVVSFTDESTSAPDDIISWSWVFGDGGVSTDQNPSYTYTDDGIYAVELTVTDDDGSTDAISHDVTINDLEPTAAFSWTPESQDEGALVVFTDASTSSPDVITSWAWDFGDSAGTSDEQNPSYTYTGDGTYTVELTVTDDDGSTDAISHDVTVNDLGPTAAFSWTPEPQDEGAPIAFTDESTSSPDAIASWAWDFGYGADTSDEQNPAYTYVENGTYTVTLTVTDDDGSTDAISHDVTVNDLGPTAEFTWPPEPQDEGSPIQFTDASIASTGDPIETWAWDFGDSAGTSDEQNPAYTYAENGVYTVELTITDDDGSTDVVSHDVTVNDLVPTAAFSWTPEPQNEGSPVQFTDESTSPLDELATWAWDFGDGNTSSLQSPSHTYAGNGIYSVELTVTDDDSSTDTVSHDVTVVDLGPAAAFSWKPEPQAEGAVVSFTDESISAPDAIVSWSWVFGDGGVSADQNPSYTYTDDGIYTVELTVTDDDGSTDTVSHDVTVTDLEPTASFSWTPTSPAEGATVQFTDASTSSPDAIVSWAWTFGDGGVSTNQSPSHVYANDGTYTVELTVTDDDGSTDAVSHDVIVIDLEPTAAFSWTPASPAEGAAVQFADASTSSPDAIVSWAWNFGDGAGTSTAQNPSYTYTGDGTYTVELTVTDDDGSTNTVSHDVVVADLAPTAAFSWTPEPQNEGSPVQFTDESTSPLDELASWAWDFGNGNTSTLQNPAYVYPDDKSYVVTLTVTDDDGSTDDVQHIVTINNVVPVAQAAPGQLDQTVPGRTQVFLSLNFTDVGISDTHTAEINWDDGTVEDGVVAQSAGSGTVTGDHVYQKADIYQVTITITDDDGGATVYHVTVTVTGIELLSAVYDVLDTTLELTFDDPVLPMLTCYDGIGMEFDDGGDWNVALSNQSGYIAETGAGGTNTVVIDLNKSRATVVNLALAALVEHKDVDMILGPAAFKDGTGNENVEVLPTDDIPLQFITYGYNLGKAGDVSGDGDVSAYDAALILRYTVIGDSALPIEGVAKDLSLWFMAYGQNVDVAEEAADVDDDGIVSGLDVTAILRESAGFDAAPALGGEAKTCRLSVSNYDDGKLDVSIDLNDVKNLYSAEIVMTYDPQRLTVADVSKTCATSEWLSADAAEAGTLKISMAGATPPAENGSLVTVTFDGNRDAIKQLNIAELKLNGGRMKATIENLPKAFALMQNYPNPFNPETWIPYRLSEPADVAITIYNMNGQMVRRLELGSGLPGHYVDKSKAAYWDGRNESGEMVSSGIYFYQLQAGRDASVRKMIILK